MIISPLKGSRGKDWRITQPFGVNPERYKQFGMIGHNGIDFAGSKPGDIVPCYACYDGLISKVGNDKEGYGKFVKILTDKDGKGYRRELIYGHLSKVKVFEGERIYLGDEVGLIGNTGNSSGVHLHLGLRRKEEGDRVTKDYNNGFFGYVDFEPYLLEWKQVYNS